MYKQLKKKEAQLSKERRFRKTLDFIQASQEVPRSILDLGSPNQLSERLSQEGFEVSNAHGVDFDLHPEIIAKDGFDAVTIFEVLEHLINPMGILKEIKAPKLYASIPMRLWFAKAYRNKNNEWDQHYHEFEDWQFDWLLQKSGWEVIRSEKWNNPALIPGIRPLLRTFTPRYYIVEARRINV